MISELCIEVINSFKQLRSSLNTVTEHVCVLDRNLPAWFQPPARLPSKFNSTQREQACALLEQLEYIDGQQPREILVGAGIIAASAETILAIQRLNLDKKNFKQAMLKLKAAKIAPSHELLASSFEQILPTRDAGLATTLNRMGLARIHLKQCYRIVPNFNLRPNKIAWTWANTRSIKRISVATALEMLLKHTHDAGLERQIKLLQGLDINESLAVVQDLAPHLRANIVMPEGSGSKRLMVKGPVPIFYLSTDNTELPDFTPAGTKRGKNKERVIRKDVKINPEPFLPAIRAHRYYDPTTAADLELVADSDTRPVTR